MHALTPRTSSSTLTSFVGRLLELVVHSVEGARDRLRGRAAGY